MKYTIRFKSLEVLDTVRNRQMDGMRYTKVGKYASRKIVNCVSDKEEGHWRLKGTSNKY